jgi:hypothetical protein
MSIAEDHTLAPRHRRRKDERDYALAFWVAFPFFLTTAALSRLMPRSSETPTPAHRQSIFRQAWVAANSSIPFAFMN